jgi:hypothetical protein
LPIDHPAAERAEMVPFSWCEWRMGEMLPVKEAVCGSRIVLVSVLRQEAGRLRIVFVPMG